MSKTTSKIDLLSHLPKRDESFNWDLSLCPPFREVPVRPGTYLCELAAGPYMDGPIYFSPTKKGHLNASFVVVLHGRLEQTRSGTQLTKTLAGERVSLSEHNAPFPRGGSRMQSMLRALGCPTKPQTDQQARQAMTQCIGSLAVIQLTHRGSVKLDSGEWKNCGELDFDGEGEIEVYTDNGALVRGQPDPDRPVATVTAHEEVAKWSRWHGAANASQRG